MTPKLLTERLILREIKGNDIFGYYKIRSDSETMLSFGGSTITNDLENKDFVQRKKIESEKGVSFFWTITLKEEKEFIGFVGLVSYAGGYYDISFSAIGERRFDPEFLEYFDKENGWEIDYALLKEYRNKGIMKEAVGAVLKYCVAQNINPIYAKVYAMKNSSTLSVLSHHNFATLMPQIDERLFSKYDHQTILENKEYGMIFKWTI